ncbi:MAG: TonB-dependent receptor [Chitinophagaceae bacterium]|nr:TonB-dependent receptor [Chitinophagaceae bacterium]
MIFFASRKVPLMRALSPQFRKVMKLTAVFLTLAFLQVSAKSFPQITLSLKNVPVEKVFFEIERQAGYGFLYTRAMLSGLPKVTVKVKNSTVSEVLDECFKGQPIEYSIDNNTIIVREKISRESRQLPDQDPLPPVQVRGRVHNPEGEALQNVSVIIVGTNTGTTTDSDGRFTITAPDDKNMVLEFSSVGYQTKRVNADNKTELNVVLELDIAGLSDVVVVGYGQIERRDVTGAVHSLQSKQIVRSNPVSAAKALQGQVAGVVVQKKNNQPGQEFSIDIRGENTIKNTTEPLVVIDGLIGGRLRDINPDDIKTIDILKDASSTAIYGSRGANGVVIITTKKGISGSPTVTLDSYIGYKKPAYLPTMLNAQEYNKIFVEDLVAAGGTARRLTANEKAIIESGNSVDWVDEVTRPGLQTSNTLAVSGGSKNTTYRFSGGYLQEDGNLIFTNYKRYNLNAGIDSRINNFLKVGFTGYLNYSSQATGSRETLRSAYRARPTGTIFYDDLVDPTDGYDAGAIAPYKGYALWMGIADNQVMNPLIEANPENSEYEVNISNMMGNAYVEITPFKGLTFKSSLSASAIGEKQGDYRGTYSKDRAGTKKPKAQYDTRDWRSWTMDNMLTYNYTGGDHKLTVTALQSAFRETYETHTTAVEDLPYESKWYALGTAGSITKIISDLTEKALTSYMGRINYGYNDKYLLTLTARSDGASQLGEGHKWAFFPSAAMAWRLGEEEFIRRTNMFSNLKLRVSYGVVGNSTVDPYSTQATIQKTAYDFDGVAAYGFAPENLGNKELRWEKSRELNFGLDIALLNNRVAASVEVYNRKTVDLIFSQKIPLSNGFSDVDANIGQIGNKGVEVDLTTVNIAREYFNWTTNISFARNNNKILQLYGGDNTEDKGNKWFVGYSLKSNYYYQFDGIWQLDEADEAAVYGQVPGSVKVVDQNKDQKIMTSDDEAKEDRVVLGTELPKFTLGMTNRFSYRDWDLSFFIYYRNGTQFKNSMLAGTFGDYGNNRYNHMKLNYWTKENPTNDYYGLGVAQPYKEAIYYQNADFLRISDITLGYTLPKKKIQRLGINALRVYGQVSNPFLFTKFDGMDPEYNSGAYIDDVPNVLFAVGLNVTF